MITIKRSGPGALLHAVGSLWFAAVLLMLSLIAMACATVYESAHGAQQALISFYYSDWFLLLMYLLGVNILASLLARMPFSRKQVGFVVTHVSLLITFSGALITKCCAVNGQVGLTEGQTINRFAVNGEMIEVLNQHSGDRSMLDLEDALSDLDSPTDLRDVPSLTLDELRVEVVRYLPDSDMRRRVHDDNPHAQPAIEASFSDTGLDDPTWLLAGQTMRISSVPVSFRPIDDPEALTRLLNPRAESESNSKGTIKIEYEGHTYEFSVEEAFDKPMPLGDAGYAARVLSYLPHAIVGADNKIVSASNKRVNPYVEVEIVGPGVSETRKAFARFPDFQAMHGETRIKDLKLAFIADSDDTAATPIEVLGGPDGELYARFSSGAGVPAVSKLEVGEVIDTPWPNKRFAVLRRYANARQEWTLEPVEPAREAPTPAVLLKCTAGQDRQEVWIQKYQIQAAALNATSYEMSYQNLSMPLGFTVTLDKFSIGTYPGTRRPRSFESHVTVSNPSTGRSQSQVISMNHPAEFGGYTLFQSSYDTRHERPASFLSVSRDPGQPVIFAGYIGVMLGMLIVLITRLPKRQREVPASIAAAKSMVVPLVLLVGAATASAADLPTSLDMTVLRATPTQHDGRWPPLDTTARDLVESVTGDAIYQGRDPVTVLLAWTFDSSIWEKEPLIEISNAELRAELRLSGSQTVFSYAELVAHDHLHDLVKDLSMRGSGGKLNPLEDKVGDINQKLIKLQNIFNENVIRMIPHPDKVGGAWRVIAPSQGTAPPHGGDAVQAAWAGIRQAFLADDAPAFTEESRKLRAALRALPAVHRPDERIIDTELRYNRLRPYRTAWIVMAIGAVLAAAALLIRNKLFDGLVIVVMLAGFAILTYGLALRWQIAGRIPAANMFESLLFLSWGMGAFAIVAMFVQRQRVVPLTASFMGALSLFLADVLPMDGFIRPIPPVLLDTIWMSIHVPIIMVSYSILALAMLIAHVQMFVMAAAPNKRELAQSIDTMHYFYVFAGSILLAAGIITGSMWAASSWGRYWGWDPKEVWSLIAFLGYMTILHVRVGHERVRWWMYVCAAILGAALFVIVSPKLAPLSPMKLAGLASAAAATCVFVLARGPFAAALKSIVAFWLILMTYLGVNYVLGTGLHSYGFGAGAVAGKMLVIGGIDLALMTLCSVVYLTRRVEKNIGSEAVVAG